MQRIHGSAIRDSVGAAALCSALAVALNDPQSSTRQLAVTTVASLYPVYGEALVVSVFRSVSVVNLKHTLT